MLTPRSGGAVPREGRSAAASAISSPRPPSSPLAVGGAPRPPCVSSLARKDNGRSGLVVSADFLSSLSLDAAVPAQRGVGQDDEEGVADAASSQALQSVAGAARTLGRTVLPLSARVLASVGERPADSRRSDRRLSAEDSDSNDAESGSSPRGAEAATNEVARTVELFSVLLEYAKTNAFAPEGVYCAPSWHSLRLWDGVMFLTHGVYGGSVFRFRILLPALYPAKPPRVFFLDSVFHPLVDPKSGEVELRGYFREWSREEDYISMVLHFLKALFFQKELMRGTDDEALWKNREAADLFRSDKGGFLAAVAKGRATKDSVFVSVDARAAQTAALVDAPEEEDAPYEGTGEEREKEEFVFSFKPLHRPHKQIMHALTLLAEDSAAAGADAAGASEAAEAFADWLLGEWAETQFQKGEKTGGEEEARERESALALSAPL